MNGTKLLYFDDNRNIIPATGYRVIRKMGEGDRVYRYPLAIIRRRCDPTYSVVDMKTGYRYPTEARTIHEANRFAMTVDLSKQPALFSPAWKQCYILEAAYREEREGRLTPARILMNAACTSRDFSPHNKRRK